jgi:hypothetical protein
MIRTLLAACLAARYASSSSRDTAMHKVLLFLLGAIAGYFAAWIQQPRILPPYSPEAIDVAVLEIKGDPKRLFFKSNRDCFNERARIAYEGMFVEADCRLTKEGRELVDRVNGPEGPDAFLLTVEMPNGETKWVFFKTFGGCNPEMMRFRNEGAKAQCYLSAEGKAFVDRINR